MIEISMSGSVDASIVANEPIEDVEEMLHQEIESELKRELMKNIDEMDFIQMSLNEEDGKFEYQAELVLCSKSSIVTNIQLQAQAMKEYGLDPEQIERVLKIVLTDTKGF